MGGYAGKTIVITGAAGGIGCETAKLFSARDADLHLIDRDGPALQELCGQLTGSGKVTSAESSLDSVAACRTALEDIDVPVYALLHLAGIFVPDYPSDDPRAVWNSVIAANLTTAADMIEATVPALDPQQVTRLVLISSLAFRRGSPDHLAYSAAKGGITGMVRALSRRLAPMTLVNGLSPGHIDTSMPSHIWADQIRAARMLSEIPLRRRGHASEVAGAIEFLCGPASTYITGQVINVDGGIANG